MPDPVSETDESYGMAAIQRYTESQNQIAASMQDLTTGLAAAKSAAGGTAGGAYLQAAGQKLINESEYAAKVKLQHDDAVAAATVGMEPGSSTSLVMQVLSKYNATAADLEQRRSMIEHKQGTGITDDPLQWLTNQISLPFDIAAYNTAVDGQESRKEQLAILSKTFDDQARVNARVDVNTSASLLDGLNRIALGKAQEAASRSAMEVAQLGISVANMRVAMTDRNFQGVLQLGKLMGEAQDRQFKVEEFQFRQSEASKADARYDEQLILRKQEDARAEQRVAMEKIHADIASTNNVQQQEGITAFNDTLKRISATTGIRPINYFEYKLLDGDAKKQIDSYIFDPDLARGFLAPTPSLAIDKAANLPLTPGSREIATKLANITAATANKEPQLWKTLGPEVQRAKKDVDIYNKMVDERANIPDAGGFYSPANLSGVLTMRSLYNEDGTPRLQIMNDLIPLAAADRTRPTKASDILYVGVQNILSGKMTADQVAQEVSTLYQAIGMDNNTINQYAKFQLPLLSPSSISIGAVGKTVQGYQTSITIPGRFNSNINTDMMNPTSILNTLQRLRGVVQGQINQGVNTNALIHDIPTQGPIFETDYQRQLRLKGKTGVDVQ